MEKKRNLGFESSRRHWQKRHEPFVVVAAVSVAVAIIESVVVVKLSRPSLVSGLMLMLSVDSDSEVVGASLHQHASLF